MWASVPEWNLNTERTVVFSQQILTHPRNLLLHLKCSSNFHLEVPSLPDCVSGQEMAFLLINSSAFKSWLLMAETVPPGISTDAALSKQHPQKQSQCCLRAGLHNQLGKVLLFAVTSQKLQLELLALPGTMSHWSTKAVLQGIVSDSSSKLESELPSSPSSLPERGAGNAQLGGSGKKAGRLIPQLIIPQFKHYPGLSSACFLYSLLNGISR